MAEPEITDARARDQSAIEHEIAELYQAAKSRVKALADAFHPDLQPVGFGILRFVFEHQPVRAQDVTAHLGMDKGAVSRQVTALREMGLLETREDPDDRRAVLLVASTSASAKREQFRSETRTGYGRIFAEWPDADMSDFARLLARFNSAT